MRTNKGYADIVYRNSSPRVRFSAVLCDLYARGHRTVSAGQVAELMWPDSRRHNAKGQTMHVGSAVAARMLRAAKGVTEIEPLRWELWGLEPNDKVQAGAPAGRLRMTETPIARIALEPLVISFNESMCMGCNPFEGDFGAPGDKCLKDRMGTARKPGPCSLCCQEIQPGERIRIAAHIFDGQLHSYRWCALCCAAMAASWGDDGRAFEARAHLGR